MGYACNQGSPAIRQSRWVVNNLSVSHALQKGKTMKLLPVMYCAVWGLALALPGVAPKTYAATPGVDPSSVSKTVAAGQCVTITKTVHTPPIPPKPDIVFLADTTGSMGPTLANVQANADNILATVDGADSEAQFGAASYKAL